MLVLLKLKSPQFTQDGRVETQSSRDGMAATEAEIEKTVQTLPKRWTPSTILLLLVEV